MVSLKDVSWAVGSLTNGSLKDGSLTDGPERWTTGPL